MNKLLITGGTGFIGKCLTYDLSKKSVAFRLAVRKELVNKLYEHTVVGNIDGQTSWAEALNGINIVIHIAGRSHIMNDNNSSAYKEVNIDGTLNLARQAAKRGIKRFVFLSSIGVNGQNTNNNRAFTEQDRPNPADIYALSKYEAECGLLNISKLTGLEVVIIRPPLVYGRHAPGNFGSLIKLCSKKILLPLGAINNKRSFISVNNLVDFLGVCIEHPDAAGKVFLVSDDDDISTTELLRCIVFESGNKSYLIPIKVSFLRIIAGMVGKSKLVDKLSSNLQIDMTYTKNVLGWKPPLSFKEGIRRCFTDD